MSGEFKTTLAHIVPGFVVTHGLEGWTFQNIFNSVEPLGSGSSISTSDLSLNDEIVFLSETSLQEHHSFSACAGDEFLPESVSVKISEQSEFDEFSSKLFAWLDLVEFGNQIFEKRFQGFIVFWKQFWAVSRKSGDKSFNRSEHFVKF